MIAPEHMPEMSQERALRVALEVLWTSDQPLALEAHIILKELLEEVGMRDEIHEQARLALLKRQHRLCPMCPEGRLPRATARYCSPRCRQRAYLLRSRHGGMESKNEQ